MNFPNPPFPVYKQHKENKPWFFQKPLTAVTGDITHSWLPEGPPTQLRPSTISSISRTQKRPAQLLYKMSQRVSLLTFHRQAPTQGLQCTRTSEPHCLHLQKQRTAPPVPAPLACCSHGGSLWEAPRRGRSLELMQPPTDSGVSSIITPLSLWDLCLNEACFLPDAISFYPGWRLKADQWGQYIWCHFNLQQRPPSLSVCLKHTERSILPKNG